MIISYAQDRFRDVPLGPIVGASVTSALDATPADVPFPWRTVIIGTATGTLVFLVTRILDRWLDLSGAGRKRGSGR